MRRHVTLTLSAVAALAAGVCAAPAAARAATPLTNTIVINPSSGCGMLTAYTAGTVWPAWSGPAPSCGAGALTLAFNQGNTPPPPLPRGVAAAGSALLAWFSSGVPQGARMGYQLSAPPGMTIKGVDYDASRLQNIADGYGWIGFTYSNSGTAPVRSPGTAVDAAVSGPLNTPYWGIELRCVQSRCVWPGEIQLSVITVVAQEAQGPSITPVADSGSLWDQTGHWIWNKPADAWPLPVAAADPSGICALGLQVGTGPPIADSSLPSQNNSSWQECQQPASWTAAVDTTTPGYVNSAGQMPLTLQAENAAGLPNPPTSEILNVDNDPVGVSLSTPNDPSPTVWVNHAVTVDATTSTGLSGLGGVTCDVNGAAAQTYPTAGLTVDGDGVRTVSCTAWNNAVDPHGNHNSGTSSVTVHIDEAPPLLSLQPVNPNDPTALVADTSDSESGVAGGSIEMAPAGTAGWTALPTTFAGGQLVGHFDDAGLHGLYAFNIRACSNVGNCTSTTRTMTLPVRTEAVSEVSLEQIRATRCARPAAKRDAAASPTPSGRQAASDTGQAAGSGLSGVSLAPRGGAVSHRALRVRVPIAAGRLFAGGSSWSLRLSRSRRKAQLRIARRATRRQEELGSKCGTSSARLATAARVAFGQPVRLHGLLMSRAGLPLAGQPIAILTAPDNGSNAFAADAAATTGADGSWTATLPPGPSRIIRAFYPGSSTVLPASGQATAIVPARIEINITPKIVPWGSTLRITGRVLGGYVPTNSNLLRLNVGIGRIGHLEGLPKIDPDGRFLIVWKFDPGQGVLHPWFSVGTLSESAFPYAAGTSKQIVVTVGEPTPAAAVPKSHHGPRRKHHKHKPTRKRTRR